VKFFICWHHFFLTNMAISGRSHWSTAPSRTWLMPLELAQRVHARLALRGIFAELLRADGE
jgi:hypothetical protein